MIRLIDPVMIKKILPALKTATVPGKSNDGCLCLVYYKSYLPKTARQIQEAQAADITNYDRDTLLRFGVVSWSYPVKPIVDVGINGLDELDEPTAKFLAEAIFEFSRPDTKEEAKNE